MGNGNFGYVSTLATMQLAVNGVIIQEQLSASVSERPWVSAHYG